MKWEIKTVRRGGAGAGSPRMRITEVQDLNSVPSVDQVEIDPTGPLMRAESGDKVRRLTDANLIVSQPTVCSVQLPNIEALQPGLGMKFECMNLLWCACAPRRYPHCFEGEDGCDKL